MNLLHYLPPITLAVTVVFFVVKQFICTLNKDCSTGYLAMGGIIAF